MWQQQEPKKKLRLPEKWHYLQIFIESVVCKQKFDEYALKKKYSIVQ